MSEVIRILLVDDHSILRQGLSQLLATDTRLQVVGEAEDGEAAIVQALTLKPDVIVMDANLPKVTGYEASQAILTAWPAARILLLTNQDEPAVIRKFVTLGVKGVFLKDVALADLIDGLCRIAQGETLPLTGDLAERMAAQSAMFAGDYAALTEREQEVLQALSKGYTNQQLADLLMVSPKTVHNHLYNIYQKIGVSTRAEAIVWAIRQR